jgi:ABC-type transporter Mla MlaB component
LALLIAWVRDAAQQGCELRFEQMSEQMRSLAKVTGVDRVLSIH